MSIRHVVTAVCLCFSVACVGVLPTFESEQMRRARDFIAVGDLETARSELRVQLHQEPQDEEAKALLLFIHLAEGGQEAARDCLLDGLEHSETSAELDAARMDARKRALGAGVPTGSWAEYEAVLTRAVSVGWGEPAARSSRSWFALCRAAAGHDDGAAYLAEQLAYDEARADVQAALYLLGDRVRPALVKVLDDPQHLSRDAARMTLQHLAVRPLYERLKTKHPVWIDPFPSVRRPRTSSDKTVEQYVQDLGWMGSDAEIERMLTVLREESPVVFRRARIDDADFLFGSLTLPSEGSGTPKRDGTGATHVTYAWRWSEGLWTPLAFDGEDALSGASHMLLAASTDEQEGMLQLRVYRGVKKKTVGRSWRKRSWEVPRVETLVLAPSEADIRAVRTLDSEGREISTQWKTAPPPASRSLLIPQPVIGRCTSDLDGDGKAEQILLFAASEAAETELIVVGERMVTTLAHRVLTVPPREARLVCATGRVMLRFPDPLGASFRMWAWTGTDYVETGTALAARDKPATARIVSQCRGDIDGDEKSERALLFEGARRKARVLAVSDDTVTHLYDKTLGVALHKTSLICSRKRVMWALEGVYDAFWIWSWAGDRFVASDGW